MNLDIDFLIDFFKQNTKFDSEKEEFTEQDAGASGGGSTGGGTSKPMPKWAETYPIKRGKANMLGLKGEKWESGLTRGAANKIW